VTQPLVFTEARAWGDMVARLFSGDAPAEIVPPGIVLASDRPEWRILRGETPWIHHATSAVLAANFSIVGVTQAQIDRVSVVQGFAVPSQAALSTFRFGMIASPTILGTLSRAASRDLRLLTTTTQAGNVQQAGDPLPGINVANGFNIPANGAPLLVPIPDWELSGGDSLIVCSNAVNQAAQATFWGYERRLRPEEQKAGVGKGLG
jgi:hypothetical protein